MSMSAACTLSSATATAGGAPVQVTCTVTNTTATAVAVLSIKPKAYVSGGTQEHEAVSLDIPDINPTNYAVSSAATQAFRFSVQFHGPQVAGSAGQNSGPTTQAIDIVCEVRYGDGTAASTNAVTVTVSASPHN